MSISHLWKALSFSTGGAADRLMSALFVIRWFQSADLGQIRANCPQLLFLAKLTKTVWGGAYGRVCNRHSVDRCVKTHCMCMCMYLPHVWRCSRPDLRTHAVEEPFRPPHPPVMFPFRANLNFFLYSFTTAVVLRSCETERFWVRFPAGSDCDSAACCLPAGALRWGGWTRWVRSRSCNCSPLPRGDSFCILQDVIEQWDLNFAFNMFRSALALLSWDPNWQIMTIVMHLRRKSFFFLFSFTINQK